MHLDELIDIAAVLFGVITPGRFVLEERISRYPTESFYDMCD